MLVKLKALAIKDRIGISTHFLPATHGENIFEAISMVSKAGFRGFEIVPTLDQAQLGFPSNIRNVGIDLFDATSREIADLKDAVSVFEWVTVHTPHLDWNLASANRHFRRLTRDYYDRCLEFAAEIDAIAMTFHLGGATHGFVRESKEILEHNTDYARHAIAIAEKFAIPVGFEAGDFGTLNHICRCVPGWGINLDIGHAYMCAGSDEVFFRYIDELGGRIVEVHHNGVNQYWGGYMEHQPPHMNNTIDFQTTYSRLRDIGYAGPIVCEIQGQDIRQTIEHCLESKEMIIAIWEGAKMVERWRLR